MEGMGGAAVRCRFGNVTGKTLPKERKKGTGAAGSAWGNQRAAPALLRSLSGIAVIVSLARGELHKRRCYIPWNEK